MPIRDSIDVLLRPRSVAIVGASSDPTKLSGAIVHQIQRLGFGGPLYLVNPKYDRIGELRCFDSVEELRGRQVDVAVISLPAQEVPELAKRCADIGVRGLIILTAGFAETGKEGQRLQRELRTVAQENDLAICGPNTAGMANFNAGFVAFATNSFAELQSYERGNVALISASGGLGGSIYSYCAARHVRVSHLVGVGNEVATTAADYLAALVDDPDVRCALVLVEAMREPERFFAAAKRALARGIPVVAMKQGRSDVGLRTVMTHTGSLAGSASAVEAALRDHGIVEVRELAALADCAAVFTAIPRLDSYRLGVFSLPGGGTSLVADAARERGFTIAELGDSTTAALRSMLPRLATPGNPLDPTAGFARDPGRLTETLRTFVADPNIDVLLFFQCAAEREYARRIGRAVIAAARAVGKPVICLWENGPSLESDAWAELREAGIPVFASTVEGLEALAAHRRYWSERDELLSSRRSAVDQLPGFDEADVLGAAARPAPGAEFLAAMGVGTPASVVVSSADEAAEVARDLGGPVAVKLHADDVLHRSELGGVRLNVTGDADVRAAYRAVVAGWPGGAGTALVQQFLGAGTEIIVGIHSDVQLGPILTLGFGGVLTELVNDVVRATLPVNRADVARLIGRLRSAPLLRGYRGTAADEAALVDAVLRLSRAAYLLRDRRPEWELNPVIVGQVGAVAVDWIFRFADRPADGPTPTDQRMG